MWYLKRWRKQGRPLQAKITKVCCLLYLKKLFLFSLSDPDPNPPVHVEASLRLPPDVGRPRGGQLPRCDPGAPPRLGQDEEPNHQEVEAPDWHTYPCQLPRYPPQCRLLSYRIWRFCCVNIFIHPENIFKNSVRIFFFGSWLEIPELITSRS